MYSYPAEMKIYSPGCAIACPLGEMGCTGRHSGSANQEGLLYSGAFYGEENITETSMSLGYFLDTPSKLSAHLHAFPNGLFLFSWFRRHSKIPTVEMV